MNDIIPLIEKFFENEFQINNSNYFLDKNDWSKLLEKFKKEYLTDKTKERWVKIRTISFSEDKIENLRKEICKRKIYLIKKIKYKNINYINVFCSWPNKYNDLRECFVFKILNHKIKLCFVDTVCESCFGTGCIENDNQICNNCFGTGFSFDSKSNLVIWNTISNEFKNIEESILLNFPDSEVQKEVLKKNC